MLIRLHHLVSVNPQNVAAVLCGDHLFVTLRMTNGSSHNINCERGNTAQVFAKTLIQLRDYDDFYAVDETRAVNINHIISLSVTKPGVVINMTGGFEIYLPTQHKAETIARVSRELEQFK